jgi:hypothetical protein
MGVKDYSLLQISKSILATDCELPLANGLGNSENQNSYLITSKGICGNLSTINAAFRMPLVINILNIST